ncbi:MAG TPA: hypothetical protein DCZ20_04005 [Lachnospiraceae bacterium]|nr:hypothetical protein [Lachnospiraceae bacterium]
MSLKRDEERRSRLWDVVMTVATTLIVVIAVFFIVKLFTANPLEGTWQHEKSDLQLVVRGNNSMTARLAGVSEGSAIRVKLNYTIDKDAKTITIRADESSLAEAAENSDGKYTESGLQSEISLLTNTFDYNVEKNTLTLTEREYGDQVIFQKK